MSTVHAIEMEVRDYECDAEGIVNNAVYLHYLEHARHSLLRSRGLSFMELTKQGVMLVVTRAEVDYLSPLRGGEVMRILTSVEKASRLRFLFRQEIVRLPGEEPVLRARITGTSLNTQGRPTAFPSVDELMGA